MKRLELHMKSIYGNNLLYPSCPESKLLSELICKKTFDKQAIDVLQRMGYEIVCLNHFKLEDATR